MMEIGTGEGLGVGCGGVRVCLGALCVSLMLPVRPVWVAVGAGSLASGDGRCACGNAEMVAFSFLTLEIG